MQESSPFFKELLFFRQIQYLFIYSQEAHTSGQ